MSVIKCQTWGNVASSDEEGEEGLEILSFLLSVYIVHHHGNSPEAHPISLRNNYSADHQGSLSGQGENKGMWMV